MNTTQMTTLNEHPKWPPEMSTLSEYPKWLPWITTLVSKFVRVILQPTSLLYFVYGYYKSSVVSFMSSCYSSSSSTGIG